MLDESPTGSDVPTTSALPRPLFRGRLHQIAVIVAIPMGVLLINAARTGSHRVAVTVYVISLIGLLGTSAAYHRLRWTPPARLWMQRLDHSMIFLLIAGTNTAYAILVLEGLWRWVDLVVVWAGAIVGITLKMIKIDGFSRIGGALYIILGWIGIFTLPQALQSTPGAPLILVGAGGIMYTLGAIVLFRRRPDPSPRVFGYHEIWHSFVVAACACHYVAITLLVRAA